MVLTPHQGAVSSAPLAWNWGETQTLPTPRPVQEVAKYNNPAHAEEGRKQSETKHCNADAAIGFGPYITYITYIIYII